MTMTLPIKPDNGGRPIAATAATRNSKPASREPRTTATGSRAEAGGGAGSSASASRNSAAVHSVVLSR